MKRLISKKYKTLKDGEWYKVDTPWDKEMCCDCGLVHWFRVVVDVNGDIRMMSIRDDRATAQARRKIFRRAAGNGVDKRSMWSGEKKNVQSLP